MSDAADRIRDSPALPGSNVAGKCIQHIERLLDTRDIAIAIADTTLPDYPLAYVNRGFEAITGYQAAEAIGRNCRFLQGPETNPAKVTLLRNAIREERSIAVELVNYRRDGTPFLARLTLLPQHRPDGRLEAYVSMMQDVSDAARLKRQMQSNMRMLAKAQAVAKIGFWEWDMHSGELSLTPGAEEIFGYTEEDVSGGFDTLVGNVHPEDRPFATRWLQSGSEDGIAVRFQPPGLTLRYLYWDRIEVLGTRQVGIVQNVSDRLSREAELRHLHAKASEESEAKSRFLARMSHELRTPLNAILGFADLAAAQATELDVHAPVLDALNEIRSAGVVLTRLVEDVLSMAQLEAGTLSVNLEAVDVLAAVSRAVRQLAPMAERAGVDLRLQVDRPCSVLADEVRLQQVLSNLISNALKFTPNGGCVTITVERAGADCIVVVRDTGIGMDPDDLKRVFEPFYQAQEGLNRRCNGAGLGLTIARDLLVLQGGELSLSSRMNEGTTARISLPLWLPVTDN